MGVQLSADFREALSLRKDGKLVDAEDLCIQSLRSDPDRFDLLVLLYRLRLDLNDPQSAVGAALNGALEVGRETDESVIAETTNFTLSVRLVLDLVCAERMSDAQLIARRIDKIGPVGHAEEVLRAVMWLALGEPELATITVGELPDEEGWSPTVESIRRLVGQSTDASAVETVGKVEDLIVTQAVLGTFMLALLFSSWSLARVVSHGTDPEPDQFSRARWGRVRPSPILHELNRTGDSLRNVGEPAVAACCASQEWLQEVLARAENLERSLRFEPIAPSTLRTNDLKIIIATDSKYVHGWVSHKGRGLPVSVRIEDWECLGDERDEFAPFAFGMSILWFLDCALRVSGVGSRHFEAGQDRTWRGNSNFEQDVRRRREIPEAHRVTGHVRRLSDGREPSYEAVSRAPAYIRRALKPNETFVREHSRHGEVQSGRLLEHPKNQSNVADGLNLMMK